MKITLCAWCDRVAQYKRREDGEPNNSDACCTEHFARYFARHASLLSRTDLPSRSGRAGGKHKVGA